jgi:hypothetical protein
VLKKIIFLPLYVFFDLLVGIVATYGEFFLLVMIFPPIKSLTGYPVPATFLLLYFSSVFFFNAITNHYLKVMNTKGNIALSLLSCFLIYGIGQILDNSWMGR